MSNSSRRSPDISIEIAPKADYLVILRHLVSCLAQHLGLTEVELGQLEMCIDEACANSINGIRENPSEEKAHKVRLDISIVDSCLHFYIHDPGKDFSKHLDRAVPMTEACDRTKTRGYGLQIIKTFMDEVNYTHDPEIGNLLHLTKIITRE